jgi:hypothetical protein
MIKMTRALKVDVSSPQRDTTSIVALSLWEFSFKMCSLLMLSNAGQMGLRTGILLHNCRRVASTGFMSNYR